LRWLDTRQSRREIIARLKEDGVKVMHYPIVVHKDSESDYSVTVPDLPGCFSAGETLDEALE